MGHLYLRLITHPKENDMIINSYTTTSGGKIYSDLIRDFKTAALSTVDICLGALLGAHRDQYV